MDKERLPYFFSKTEHYLKSKSDVTENDLDFLDFMGDILDEDKERYDDLLCRHHFFDQDEGPEQTENKIKKEYIGKMIKLKFKENIPQKSECKTPKNNEIKLVGNAAA